MESLTEKTYEITYTYMDCLKMELMENEELKNFFINIDREYQKVLTEKEEELENKIVANKKIKEDKINYAEGLVSKLRIMGLNFLDFNSSSFMCNDIKISYNYLLDDDSISSKKEKSHIGYLPERKMEVVKDLNKNINKLRDKEEKSFVLLKKKEEGKKNDLRSLITKQQNELEGINDALEAYSIVDNLTNDQKILLLECIKEYQEANEIDKENSRVKLQISKLKNLESYDIELLPLSFKRMLAFDTITKEKLERLYLMLDKVEIKARRGEYDTRKYTSEDIKKIRPILKWFVANVYEEDEKFVERNKEKKLK